MLRVKRAMGAVTITALTMTGVALASPSAAQATPVAQQKGLLCTSLTALTDPVITGTGAVGEQLSITTMPTWSCDLLSAPTIQWYDAAGPIAGATGTTYTPTSTDAGGAVVAVITGQALGLVPLPVTSNAILIPALGGDTGGTGGGTTTDPVLELTSPLTVTGDPVVGQALSVADPAWSLSGVTTTYQWLRDNAAIAGATDQRYVPTADDAGHTLVAQVTGSLAGLADVVRFTDALPIADATPTDPGSTPTALELSSPLSVSGTPGVGQLLTLTQPVWNLPGVTTTYQWLRDNTPISGATDRTYLPTTDDAGHTVVAQVTGSLAGLTDAIHLSSPVPIPVPVTGGGTGGGSGGDTGGSGTPIDTVLDLASPLSVSGMPAVGQLLALATPEWNLPGVTTTYQWLRDGKDPIAGATGQTYVPVVDDAGHTVVAQVTGSLTGLADAVKLSDPLRIPAPATGESPLGVQKNVSTTGTNAIGTLLGVTGPTWEPMAATTTYQWLRDGAPIPGATDPTYLLQSADFGHGISVSATGQLVGWLSQTLTSNIVTPTPGAALTSRGAPTIAGIARVGRQLTADPGSWAGGDLGDLSLPLFTYQWLRNDEPITGAVAQVYQPTVSDIGSAISVAVNAVLPGYAAGTHQSSAVTIHKLRSAIHATLAKKIVHQGRRAVVRLRLHVPTTPRPTGVVKVRDGRHVVGKAVFKRRARGAMTLRLARLKPGVHRLRAVYVGSPKVARSSSKVLRLTVRR